jgi:hypothetical protein
MREVTYLVGSVVLGVVVLIAFVVALYGSPMGAPSQDTCVALWNAPHNTVARTQVVRNGYAMADIGGSFAEDRYQGCFAWFVGATGEPWALYSATRIPGEDTLLRWRLDLRGRRWGRDVPVPEPVPEPDAAVLQDGSLSIRG